MKSALISIQPYYVFLIIARIMGWDIPQEKTIEVRKDYPKDSAWDKRVHIYCSKNRKSFNRIPQQYQPFMEKLLGKVIGEFVCDRIEQRSVPSISSPACWNAIATKEIFDRLSNESCLSKQELSLYAGMRILCFWHISDLKIYDKPKELGEYYKRKKERNCFTCGNLPRNSAEAKFCDSCRDGERHIEYLTRPPQSWCYVEA